MPSLAVQPGQTLGQDDLNFFTRDRNGSFTDPFEITYAIFEMPGNILFGPPDRTPIRVGTGQYYANWAVPSSIRTGAYIIRWFVKDTENSPTVTVEEQFEVVGLNYLTAPQAFPEPMASLIWYTRARLRDNDPDRNYRFMPPSLEKEVQQFSKVFGFIWEDYELAMHLEMALDDINIYPPSTGFQVANGQFPIQYRSLLVTGAAAKAVAALTLNWIADEFGYSIGGKSLSIEKASKYEAMKSNLLGEFQQTISSVKKYGPGSLYTKGIQQAFYGITARASLGPYGSGKFVLTARSYTRIGAV